MDRNEYDIYNQLSGLFCNIQKGPGAAVLKELYVTHPLAGHNKALNRRQD